GKSVSRLKRSVLELLEKDLEFRYAVAGYLGLSELMKRMDSLEGNMVKLLENQSKLWEEVKGLREGQNKLWEEIRDLREGQNKLWEEVRDLRSSVRSLGITVDRLATTVERLTISIEEEAMSIIRYRVREELGLDIPLDRIFIDSREINIYGSVGDLCIIGEATVRLGVGLLDELLKKIEFVKSKKPELIKPKIIKVIYTDYATPEALEYAKKNNVWVLKWSGDLTPRVVEEAAP
ncbi:MAG: hypothetical protein QW118_06990, partial [Nitrososphaerota archaeon]